MAYEPKDGDFILSINKRKTTPKHPDYTGSIRLGGKRYFMDAWIKENKETGSQFLSGNMGKEMGRKDNEGGSTPVSGFPGTKNLPPLQPAPPPGPPPPPVQPALDDDIPF